MTWINGYPKDNERGNEIDGRYFENGGEINDLHDFQQRKKVLFCILAKVNTSFTLKIE